MRCVIHYSTINSQRLRKREVLLLLFMCNVLLHLELFTLCYLMIYRIQMLSIYTLVPENRSNGCLNDQIYLLLD